MPPCLYHDPADLARRYPSLDEFVPGYLSATPVAGMVAKLDQPTRAVILQEVKTSLRPYLPASSLLGESKTVSLTAERLTAFPDEASDSNLVS